MGKDEDQSKPTWQQLWGLRAAWCLTVLGLIGLIAVSSRWVLTEREAARVLNIDMLAMNSSAIPETRAKVTTQAAVAAGGPIMLQKPARETVHAKPSAPVSKLGKTLPKKAAISRKAFKKARDPVLAKSQSKGKLAARADSKPRLHVAPMSRARTQRFEAALKQYRAVNGKKARQCGARTSHGGKNCDGARNR